MSGDCCVILSCGAMCLSAVCDCGISSSYSLTFLIEKVESYIIYLNAMNQNDLIPNQTYYSVDFMFLSFGIMDYIVELENH